VPIASVSLAVKAAEAGWGLFNHFQLGSITAVVASMLAIDLAKYLQHYALHRVPLLWRIHRTHHADPDCDVTTSFRFHPLEIFATLLVEAAVIVAFGVPAAAVVLYQVVRIILSTLAHGNVFVPARMEIVLRRVVVTPDLHRIHHSTDLREQTGNLSGGLIWWDHLFGTYIASPALDQRTMPLGLAEYERSTANSLRAMLLDPISDPR
jgi:sterol desaturase/sphingolipid hydroxylase (fatty acid hydroxylase superfamily)